MPGGLRSAGMLLVSPNDVGGFKRLGFMLMIAAQLQHPMALSGRCWRCPELLSCILPLSPDAAPAEVGAAPWSHTATVLHQCFPSAVPNLPRSPVLRLPPLLSFVFIIHVHNTFPFCFLPFLFLGEGLCVSPHPWGGQVWPELVSIEHFV